ncbi:porin [Candidatus Peregrinibacteria bacterium]|nr:porin [Candidatus Peregrinibacteria bacterium]
MRNPCKFFSYIVLVSSLFTMAGTSQAQSVNPPSEPKPPVTIPPPSATTLDPQLVAFLEEQYKKEKAKESEGSFKPIAVAEVLYSYNFNRPANGITALRGFDNRHNSFTISNVVLGGEWSKQNLTAKLVLQVGHTPNSYYGAEPVGQSGGGAGSSDANTWKYVQEGWLAYKVNGIAKGLTFSAGLFLSPIGPEGMLIKDNFTVSRSNLFFGLPFYHTGARTRLQITDRWSTTLAVYNGWNSVTDNNAGKSLSGQLLYENPDHFSWSLLYFGGPERAKGATEGDGSVRHLIDTWFNWSGGKLNTMGQVNVGFERNKFGVSSWAAESLSAQYKWTKAFHTAFRLDYFHENTAKSGDKLASPIFWPTDDGLGSVGSVTLTATLQPQDNLIFRLEGRHDQSRVVSFFDHKSTPDKDGVYQPTSKSQNTITLAATAWW